MISRYSLALWLLGPLTLGGCAGLFDADSVRYVESEQLTLDETDNPFLANKPSLKGEPERQEAVRRVLVELFGESPRRLKVPPGMGLPHGGVYLANRGIVDGQRVRFQYTDAQTGRLVDLRGGYALYREHCLHCHGVSGDGNGPTADFLFPRPRDYRPGLYKFTSTTAGAKPSRADLFKTIKEGLHGTSMPAFEALMSDQEIWQVLDYMTFLSIRGETELLLIDEAANGGLDEAIELDQNRDPSADPDTPSAAYEIGLQLAQMVFNRWQAAENQVVNPPVPRTPPTPESIARGKEIFLGINQTGNQVNCYACHGLTAKGDGSNFVDQKIFNQVVFAGPILEPGHWFLPEVDERLDRAIAWRHKQLQEQTKAQAETGRLLAWLAGEPTAADHDPHGEEPDTEPLESYRQRERTNWIDGSFDDWGNPLRAADLNLGIYKGGRRPIDLYWRIAKGINGAKMPSHFPTLEPEQIWDLVNFILALPYQPDILRDAEELRRGAPEVPLPIARASHPRLE